MNVSTAYDFLHERSLRSTPWRPITASIRVQPPNYVSGDLTLNYDPIFPKALRRRAPAVFMAAVIPVTRIRSPATGRARLAGHFHREPSFSFPRQPGRGTSGARPVANAAESTRRDRQLRYCNQLG